MGIAPRKQPPAPATPQNSPRTLIGLSERAGVGTDTPQPPDTLVRLAGAITEAQTVKAQPSVTLGAVQAVAQTHQTQKIYNYLLCLHTCREIITDPLAKPMDKLKAMDTLNALIPPLDVGSGDTLRYMSMSLDELEAELANEQG